MGPSTYASSLNIIYIHYGNQEVASQIRSIPYFMFIAKVYHINYMTTDNLWLLV